MSTLTPTPVSPEVAEHTKTQRGQRGQETEPVFEPMQPETRGTIVVDEARMFTDILIKSPAKATVIAVRQVLSIAR